jgi:hypothetical protein
VSDYFDELENGLAAAVRRRAHLPWYARIAQVSAAHRGLAALVAVVIVATPTVAAVGAVSGWFATGSSPIYYPASATKGIGKVLPKGGVLLPVRGADPDGGPPWGIRLVKTTRGETCIQVGRVVNGQIGQLGIDTAWHDDHKFHEIKPNDQIADMCGATDAAGNGFVDAAAYGAPASVDIPLNNSSGAPRACVDPYMSQRLPPLLARPRRKLTPFLKRVLRNIERQRHADGDCPLNAMRMIFVGLLGPDAKSITYRTPDGQTRSQPTAAGTGAYLLVFRETARDCLDFTQSAFTSDNGCGPNNSEGAWPYLRSPSAITTVTYDNGKSCSDVPSARLTAAYRELGNRTRKASGRRARQLFAQFLARHHLSQRGLFDAIQPSCRPVGFVASKLPKLTSAGVASPIKLTISRGRRFCVKSSEVNTFDGAVACDRGVPAGDRWFYGAGPGQSAILVTVSFIARRAVSSDNSWYQGALKDPGNHGSDDIGTNENIRAGQRITLSTFLGVHLKGTYRGIMTFVQNSGKRIRIDGGIQIRRRTITVAKGTLVVGRFSFTMPLKH